MAKRHILYFTADGHRLYACASGTLQLEASFAANEAGVEEFREFVRRVPNGLFSVVADIAGEDFHEDQIPYLRGSDREAVLQRRLAQRYRDTRFAAALPLGLVASAERRNERVLLASFTNTQQLAPWLDALEESDARLAGVYSVPLLAPALAARLGMRSGRCFIVTANSAGLRQCFVDRGRLRFARLERPSGLGGRELALFLRSETVRLAQYLTTLRALPRDGAPIQVIAIAPRGMRPEFEEVLVSDGRLVFRVMDAAQAQSKARVKRVPEGTMAEALYLQMAARHAPREQFASRDDRRRYLVWQLQRAIVAAGAVGFAACTLYAGSDWLDGMGMRDQADAQLREAREAADRYARITSAFPVTQTTTENLKIAVVEFQRIAQRSASPESDYVHVSKVLEKFPQFELDRIAWSVVDAVPAQRAGGAQAAAPAEASASGSEREAVRLEISGRVNATERNDYRGITAQVQRFAAELAASGYELVRTELPFDITPEGTLTGDIGRATEGAEAPRFTIIVQRRLT